MKYLLLIIAFFWGMVQLNAQLTLNEFVSSNNSGITDEDSEYSDWLEIYNGGTNTLNLGGHFLSDDKLNLQKWQFPSYNLQPKQFLTVMASGKNRTALPYSWKTVIDRGQNWKYKVPTAGIGTTWRNLGFDDSGWGEGPSGFGYGDDDDATAIPNPSISVYIRKTFNIASIDKVRKLVLHIDYDDGFVAYINGMEVARSNMGTTGQTVEYNTLASDKEASIYSGGYPETFDISNFTNTLVQGTNVIAIEGHNASPTSTDLSLIPFLSIATEEMEQTVSVHQYFAPRENYFHTNFKLDNAGETFYLVSPTNQIVDSLGYTPLDADISYGRQPDGTKNYFYFSAPTPGTTNNNQQGAVNSSADPVVFSAQGGYYPSGLLLNLSSPVPTDKIYYTKDGSAPSMSSTLYSAPISISTDCVIKARIFRDGTLPGPIVVNTYIKGKNHKFPITSLSTDPANLWDYYTGIYVKGPNASTEDPYFGANFWQDWEKPAHFEVLDTNKKTVVNQGVGIKIFGAWSRASALKSMAVFARKQYGKGSIEYMFFDDKNIDKFESVVLRNSGNDLTYTMFRDGLMTGLARKMDVDRPAFKPSAHYLNGEYWGILNIREKVNEHFLADNHQFDTEDISLLTNDSEIVMGTNADYQTMVAYIKNNSLQTAANYQYVMGLMDVDNFIQYQLTQIFIDNTDWPGNNIKFWRVNTPESKWRWILYDTDFGFNLYWNGVQNNTLAFALDGTKTNWPNPAWSTLLLRRLVTSTEFRNNFINQYADHLNTTFLATNLNTKIDSMKTLFDGEIQYHLSKWGGTYANWTYEVNRMKTWANSRAAYAWQHLQTQFALGSRSTVQVSVNNTAQGQVKLNSIVLENSPFTGTYFPNIPIKLKALPKPGHKFVQWEGSVTATTPEISYNMATTGSFNAVFTVATDADVKVVINEINYKSATNYDTEDWIELYNNGVATVDLSGWEITDLGKEESFFFAPGTILYPGEYLIVCNKLTSFRNFHPTTKNSRGNIKFGLSSSGDKIRLFDKTGKLMDAVDYLASSPWPVIADNSGGTLELINPDVDNSAASRWVLNPNYGTPGKKNLGYVTTPVEEKPIVDKFIVSCFPNPFTDFTTIEISIPDTNHYSIEILDINGRTINVLASKKLEPNIYYIDWNGTDMNNNLVGKGVYLVKSTSSTHTKTIKVLKIN
ncbi:MAG: CotH kinase family protein [Breznakibacter sp.]